MPAKLFVGNLSFQATEEDLRELFAQAVTVESVRIVTDQFTGRPRGLPRGHSSASHRSSCEEHMSTPGVPAPGFVHRIGEIVDRRRGVEFQALNTRSLMNRLAGTAMPFGWTVNPFRGCEFGCRYCYARPTHEYLGHCDPDEFEDRIYVKRARSAQLAVDLKRARDSGQEVAIGAATDPYQPAETRFRITRAVLEAMARVP